MRVTIVNCKLLKILYSVCELLIIVYDDEDDNDDDDVGSVGKIITDYVLTK